MHVMMTMMPRQGNQEASGSLEGPRRAESGDRRAGHRVPGAEVGRWDERWWEGEGERERGQHRQKDYHLLYILCICIGGIACLSVEVEVVARFLFPSHTSNANNVPAPHCHDATPAGAGRISLAHRNCMARSVRHMILANGGLEGLD